MAPSPLKSPCCEPFSNRPDGRGEIQRRVERAVALAELDHVLGCAADGEVLVAVVVEVRHLDLVAGLRDAVGVGGA